MDHLSYMQLCRLCLVKDKVNVPIFDDANDVRQIFLKITACLPVKVSRDDNLPKKICNECLYKIDSLYQFWNTTINAEKQLLQWLNEIGVDTTVTNAAAPLQQILPQSHAHPHTEEIILKEEALEDLKPEHNNIIFPSYIPNQQQPPPPNLTKFQPADEEEEDDPPRRRTRGRPAKKKAASVLEAALTAQDSDSVDSDRLADGGADDSDYVDEERVTKEEVDSDEDYVDPLEPTQFVNVSNDAEQPGPSGLNNTAKSTTTLQPPTHTDTGRPKRKGPAKNKRTKSPTPDVNGLFTCTMCVKSFTKHSNLLRHQARHYEDKYPCKLCARNFRSPTDLLKHTQISCTRIGRVFPCDLCDKTFNSNSNLTLHRRRHTKNYVIKCEKCNRGFVARNEYKIHFDIAHRGQRVSCEHCNKTYTCQANYTRHLKLHDPNMKDIKLECPRCGKIYHNKDAFRVHVARHDNNVFVCDVCGKSVTSSASLKDHVRTHTGLKPFICAVCGKACRTSALLKVHRRTHTNEKPFTCGECGKSFTQQSTLIVHKRYHTGDRPYPCEICQKRFVTKTLMKTHVKSHGISLSDI